MISYYDLLGLLKENQHPKRVRLYLCNESRVYFYDNDNESYLLENIDSKTPIFELYLRDCLLDINSFDKVIEIMETKK